MVRKYWLIWDAASKDITDRLLQENALPNLKKLVADGIYCRLKTRQLNCQTPCALAVQFAGKSAEELGISGFHTPLLNGHIPTLNYRSSFENESISKYCLWNEKELRDKKIALCQIPYAQSLFGNAVSLECYKNHRQKYWLLCENEEQWEKDEVHGKSVYTDFVYGDQKLSICILRDRKGQADIHISTPKRDFCIRLNNENQFMKVIPFPFQDHLETNLYIALKENGECIFLFSDVYDYVSSDESQLRGIRQAAGPFQGKGYGRIYRNHGFGLPQYMGGSGRAEQIFMFVVDNMAECFERLNNYFISDRSNEIIISYQPCIDEVSHEFYGWYYNAKTENEKKFYWKLLKQAYIFADRHLGILLDREDGDRQVIVSSDHGVYSVNHFFYINSWLKKCGYLKADEKGHIDIRETKAFYHPAGNGALYFDQSIKDTLFKELSEVEILGQKIVKDIVLMNQSCKIFGDAYLIPCSGTAFSPDMENVIFEKAIKTGCHTSNVGDSSLDGILVSFKKLKVNRKHQDIYNTEIKEFVKKCFQN